MQISQYIHMHIRTPPVICFWVQFGGPQSAGLEENTDLQQYYRVIIMLFRMTLIDDYPYDVSHMIPITRLSMCAKSVSASIVFWVVTIL